ncbi:nucleoside triphosphate pyrophosphohydrolase [Candidatus Parcubacteria bacterium]|uniref:Phosphoribosyl-ATP pyrophosphohydrolase n=1 Tax=Candidatus Kaiserbacteria bacterium CG10_big_fil_rev_8_21_14_0_10_47_16 TaxID=1974608 RepID=A0A2H0UD76_9BACT|nr:nucleoside triphosphate pyrophosphohydrolase [Candidatus Parcubacteria bacterium]PIR84378.1 MAG: phosphoribosyl-ATP pyrophosphohydrolase [Candidatus Kaiserbacteria bacterium CG10_big_fil_rev_8_21_14_0_10_47_16]
MKKLVRDRIPEIIEGNGERPIVRELTDDEFRRALKDKLVEEATEVTTAQEKDELVAELADVHEVLHALYNAYEITERDVIESAEQKREARGGFTKKIFLEGVE